MLAKKVGRRVCRLSDELDELDAWLCMIRNFIRWRSRMRCGPEGSVDRRSTRGRHANCPSLSDLRSVVLVHLPLTHIPSDTAKNNQTPQHRIRSKYDAEFRHREATKTTKIVFLFKQLNFIFSKIYLQGVFLRTTTNRKRRCLYIEAEYLKSELKLVPEHEPASTTCPSIANWFQLITELWIKVD